MKDQILTQNLHREMGKGGREERGREKGKER
jgi:hypothetical protein